MFIVVPELCDFIFQCFEVRFEEELVLLIFSDVVHDEVFYFFLELFLLFVQFFLVFVRPVFDAGELLHHLGGLAQVLALFEDDGVLDVVV